MKKQKIAVTGSTYDDAEIVCNYPSIRKTFKRKVSDYPRIVWDCFAPIHGLKQKFGDAKSGGTPAEKFAEVQLIDACLMQGEWERTATHDMTPLICEAVSRIKGLPLATVLKSAEKGPDQVATWSSDVRVKAAIAKIRAERAEAAAEDADDEEEIEVEVDE